MNKNIRALVIRVPTLMEASLKKNSIYSNLDEWRIWAEIYLLHACYGEEQLNFKVMSGLYLLQNWCRVNFYQKKKTNPSISDKVAR